MRHADTGFEARSDLLWIRNENRNKICISTRTQANRALFRPVLAVDGGGSYPVSEKRIAIAFVFCDDEAQAGAMLIASQTAANNFVREMEI